MTTKTETIDHHICDLCGEEREKGQIDTLQGEPPANSMRAAYAMPGKRCDICTHCQHEPIYKVLAFLNGDKLWDPLADPMPATGSG
jgi:hypothetical protein